MAKFDIYKCSTEGVDYLLDLQDEMLENLSTRVVAPLVSTVNIGRQIQTLNPRMRIAGQEYLLTVHLLAAVPASALKECVSSAASQRDEIIAAIDLLFTGI
ncbi:MAG: CcdB family protein [Desulfuromonadales bacterium]|nr:CcdB family protein [Chloroflexota bacterium]MCK4622119.1 CcdB family protein [Desulfuromonadales bacterium]